FVVYRDPTVCLTASYFSPFEVRDNSNPSGDGLSHLNRIKLGGAATAGTRAKVSRQGMITTIFIFKINVLSPIKDYRWLYNSTSRLQPTFIFSSILVPTQFYDSVTTHLRPGK